MLCTSICERIHNLQIKEELKLEKMENEFNAIKFDMMDRNYKSNFNFMHSLLHEITTLKNRIEKSENQAEYAQSIDAIEKIVLENVVVYLRRGTPC